MEPLRFHGNELILFHVLDPQEIRPKLREPVLMVDMETERRDGSVARVRRERVRAEDRRAHRGAARPQPQRRASITSCSIPASRSMRRCANIWRSGRGGQ